MSDEVKPATLEPCTEEEVTSIAGRLIGQHHTTLTDAKIVYLWALGKSLRKWGQVRVVTEATWWMTGGMEGGVDIEIQINYVLWKRLSPAGRAFVLDHFHSLVTAKTSGQTEMETVEGTRQLYKADKPSLSVHAAVLARNPDGLREIEEVERLWRALSEPAQFLLDLQAQESEEADDDENEEEPKAQSPAPNPPRDTPPPPRPRPVPVHYYRREVLGMEYGDVSAVLRFSGAEMLPSQLNGVHVVPEGGEENGKPFAGVVHNAALSYDEDPVTIRRFRQALEDALESRRPEPSAAAELR